MRMELEIIEERKAVEKYGFHRATYYRAKKRGYFCPGYHVKKYDISSKFDHVLAYEIARACASKYFPRFLADDLIQEGVLEIFLKGGNRTGRAMYARLACQGMRNLVYNFLGRYQQKNSLSYQEGNNYVSDNER